MKTRIRTSVVCVHNGQILTFRAVDPTSGQEYFFIPGGKIEEDEEKWKCAERETFEETGYKVRVDRKSELFKEYVFHWDGQDYFCQTSFFKATLLDEKAKPATVNDAAYNKGTRWIPLEQIETVFAYDPVILAAVQKLKW